MVEVQIYRLSFREGNDPLDHLCINTEERGWTTRDAEECGWTTEKKTKSAAEQQERSRRARLKKWRSRRAQLNKWREKQKSTAEQVKRKAEDWWADLLLAWLSAIYIVLVIHEHCGTTEWLVMLILPPPGRGRYSILGIKWDSLGKHLLYRVMRNTTFLCLYSELAVSLWKH